MQIIQRSTNHSTTYKSLLLNAVQIFQIVLPISLSTILSYSDLEEVSAIFMET